MNTNFRYVDIPSYKIPQELYGQKFIFTGKCKSNKVDNRLQYEYRNEVNIKIWAYDKPIKESNV